MLSTESEMKWYIVYTKSNFELRVAKVLSQKKISNYCPVNRFSAENKNGEKGYEQPLFKCYVFVKITESGLKSLKSISGVLNHLNNFDRPAIITEFELRSLIQFVNNHINIKVEKSAINSQDKSLFNNSVKHQSNIEGIELPSLGYILHGQYTPSVEQLQSGKTFLQFPLIRLQLLRNYIRQDLKT